MSEVTVRGGAPVLVRNIICLGRTYRAHAAELNNPVPVEPLVFLKSTRCLRPLDSGPLAFEDEAFHHEAEVTVLVGAALSLGETASRAHIAAIGLGLDLTRRAVQDELKKKGHPWTTAKSFAGAALASELVPCDEIADLGAIVFSLHVEGELRQEGTTASLERPIPALLSHLSSFLPLGPGDLVFTGTPAGVGPLRRGERFVLASPSIGEFEGRL